MLFWQRVQKLREAWAERRVLFRHLMLVAEMPRNVHSNSDDGPTCTLSKRVCCFVLFVELNVPSLRSFDLHAGSLCASKALIYCEDCDEATVGRENAGQLCISCDAVVHGGMPHWHRRTSCFVRNRAGVTTFLSPPQGLGEDGRIVERACAPVGGIVARVKLHENCLRSGIAAIPCKTPMQCPHCALHGTMVRLPQVLSRSHSVCTLAHGTVTGMRFSNFFCTKCLRALLSPSKCVPFGAGAMPAEVLPPAFVDDNEGLFWVIVGSGNYWPTSPRQPRGVFEQNVINLSKSLQFRCVRLP